MISRVFSITTKAPHAYCQSNAQTTKMTANKYQHLPGAGDLESELLQRSFRVVKNAST